MDLSSVRWMESRAGRICDLSCILSYPGWPNDRQESSLGTLLGVTKVRIHLGSLPDIGWAMDTT